MKNKKIIPLPKNKNIDRLKLILRLIMIQLKILKKKYLKITEVTDYLC